jgi:hypothetical protein
MGSELEFGFLMHNRVTIDTKCSSTVVPNTKKQKNKKLELKFSFHFGPKLELNFLHCQVILGVKNRSTMSKKKPPQAFFMCNRTPIVIEIA